MATTQTLEQGYEMITRRRVIDVDGRKQVVRYFKVHSLDFDSLKPTKGDNHSVNTDEIVESVTRSQTGPTRWCLMIVTYGTSDLRTVGP